MKWFSLLLVLLISCAPTVVETESKPVAKETITAAEKEPVLEPQLKVPQETVQEEPIFEEPAEQQQLTLEQQCLSDCQDTCQKDAQLSCTQYQRSQCRANCGDIIDASACTQACTYLSQPQHCKKQFEQFCSAQCTGRCK